MRFVLFSFAAMFCWIFVLKWHAFLFDARIGARIFFLVLNFMSTQIFVCSDLLYQWEKLHALVTDRHQQSQQLTMMSEAIGTMEKTVQSTSQCLSFELFNSKEELEATILTLRVCIFYFFSAWFIVSFWEKSTLVLLGDLKPSSLCFCDRLVGLVVRASAPRTEDPRFGSHWRRDFSGSSHTSDLNIGTPVATLPCAWRSRVSAGTGRPCFSILWLGDVESSICSFYSSVAAHTIVWADPSLRYTSLLLAH